MASSSVEFRLLARTTVTLPSGLSVEIRKVRLADFLDLGELRLPSAQTEPDGPDGSKNPVDFDSLKLYANRVIVAGAVEPRFTQLEKDLARADLVHVDDLTLEDYHFLTAEILRWSGHAREVAAEADSFRADAVGANGHNPGGAIRPAAE